MDWTEQLRSARWGEISPAALGAYALGCFATGYYLVRCRTGQDIRELHSRNAGAKNAGRVLGKPAFFITVLGDFAKGALAVWLARLFTHNELAALAAMLAVVVGHVWPVQLGLRGGKGVATSLAALLVFDFRVALVYAPVFLAGYAVTRRSVVPGLLAFVVLPFAAFYFGHRGLELSGVAVLAGIVLFAHRENLVEEFATTKPQPP